MEDKSGEKNNFAPERRVKEQLIRETEYIEPPSVASVAAPAPAPAPVIDREEKERALIASLPRDGTLKYLCGVCLTHYCRACRLPVRVLLSPSYRLLP